MLPLDGVKVLDLTHYFAGPGTAMLLADFGADVVKVEPPGGDDARHIYTTPFLGPDGLSFMLLNRNKRGLMLDLARPEARAVVLKLADQVDIVLESFRPGVARALGLDYDTLRARNPRLIYGAISAFGPRGPLADKPGFDILVQAASGVMLARPPGPEGYPTSLPVLIADCSLPMLLAYAVMVALWAREKTGEGQYLDTSLLNAALQMQAVRLVQVPADPTPPANIARPIPGYRTYQTADGEYLAIAALDNSQWRRLCEALELGYLAEHERYRTPMDRVVNGDELMQTLEGVFGTRPAAEWVARLEAVGVPVSPLLKLEELFDHPQLQANELVVEVEHPQAGRTRMLGLPVTLHGTPGAVRTPAPTLGQHTVEVLSELGYPPETIADWQARQIVGGG